MDTNIQTLAAEIIYWPFCCVKQKGTAREGAAVSDECFRVNFGERALQMASKAWLRKQ